MDRAGWRDVTHALARTHLFIVVFIVLIETLVAIILVLKVLVLECFAVEEVDRARDNLGCTKVSRPLNKKR